MKEENNICLCCAVAEIYPEYESAGYCAICGSLLKKGYFSLAEVPEELRTAELCLEAVGLDSDALQYVPEELKDEIKAAVENYLEDR